MGIAELRTIVHEKRKQKYTTVVPMMIAKFEGKKERKIKQKESSDVPVFATEVNDSDEPVTTFCTNIIIANSIAPAGNRTRVCTVAGYYSTTRPLVL